LPVLQLFSGNSGFYVSGILGDVCPVLAWAHTELSMLLKQVYCCPVVPTVQLRQEEFGTNYRVASLLCV